MSERPGTHILGCSTLIFLRLYHSIPPTRALKTRIAIPNPTPAQATVFRPLEGPDTAGTLAVVLLTVDTSADGVVMEDVKSEADVGWGVEVEESQYRYC